MVLVENIGTYFKMTVAGLGTLLTYLFGGWSSLLGVLLFLVILDYVSGLTAAFLDKQLSSEIGFRGIARKVMVFAIVAVGHLIDIALGTELIMMAVIYFYMANELLSIIENSGKIGIPIPSALNNAVQILQNKGEIE